MEVFGHIVLLVIGFVLLVKGADIFVDGSADLARHFRVPGVVIGLTIVALGTSAPELAVSSVAAIQGANEIALSNVVGSNIFNLLVVLGICALIRPVPVDPVIVKRDYPVSLGAVLLVFLFSSAGVFVHGLPEDEGTRGVDMTGKAGEVGRWVGILILLLFIIYIVLLIREARKHPEETADSEEKPLKRSILLIISGLAMVILGGEGVVRGARYIASFFGMSETLIGLTIVAVGTSLPELVTSIVAARKGENGLAVGNVVGSNIFNLLFILGVSSAIHPVEVNMASFFDMIILFTVSVIVYLLVLPRRSIGRKEGWIMLLLYLADMGFAIVR